MTDGPQESGGSNVWDRLRRRKVVQWGLAYSAGAWGLLQGLSYSIATFQWPQILQPLATLALLTGLPIAGMPPALQRAQRPRPLALPQKPPGMMHRPTLLPCCHSRTCRAIRRRTISRTA